MNKLLNWNSVYVTFCRKLPQSSQRRHICTRCLDNNLYTLHSISASAPNFSYSLIMTITCKRHTFFADIVLQVQKRHYSIKNSPSIHIPYFSRMYFHVTVSGSLRRWLQSRSHLTKSSFRHTVAITN